MRSAVVTPLAKVFKLPTLGLTRVVGRWTANRTTRRALARLDNHILRDIGLSEAQASDESRKPFWLD